MVDIGYTPEIIGGIDYGKFRNLVERRIRTKQVRKLAENIVGGGGPGTASEVSENILEWEVEENIKLIGATCFLGVFEGSTWDLNVWVRRKEDWPPTWPDDDDAMFVFYRDAYANPSHHLAQLQQFDRGVFSIQKGEKVYVHVYMLNNGFETSTAEAAVWLYYIEEE